MAFPKMGFLDNLKDLVTKGPAGMVNERMKEGLAHMEELNKLDRSDPEAMKAYIARQNAAVQQRLDSNFVTRGVISDENRAHLAQMQNKAMEDSAAMYQMLNEHKAKQAAAADVTPSAAASQNPFEPMTNEAAWPPKAK